MKEGLNQEEVNRIQEAIANNINDLGIKVAENKGKDVNYFYGNIQGLILASLLIKNALEEDL